MSIRKYLQMRIKAAEQELAVEEFVGNVPKQMAEKAAIAELRGVEDFLNEQDRKNEKNKNRQPQ